MKKINILLLLLVLIVRTAAIAQEPFNPIFMNEQGQKELVEHSTLIIEGKIIGGKSLYEHTEKNSGKIYGLFVLKPTAVLKGNSDSTKTYQILAEGYGFGRILNTETGLYDGLMINPDAGARIQVPDYGIFFINENPAPFPDAIDTVDHNSKFYTINPNNLFPKAIQVGYNYGIRYGKYYPKEKVLKYLSDKFNLEAVPLETEQQPLKQTQAQKVEADSIKQVQNKLLYEQRKKNNEQYMEQRMKIMNAQKNNVDSTKQKKPK